MDWIRFCRAVFFFKLGLKDPTAHERNFFYQNAEIQWLRDFRDLQRRARSNQPRRSTLSEILVQAWHRRTAVPHGRIYAIYGLISAEKYAALKPDYSLSPVELFTRVARSAIDIDRNPAVLCLAGYTQNEAGMLERLSSQTRPSWAPDHREERLDICRQDVSRMLIGKDVVSRATPVDRHQEDLTPTWSPVFHGSLLGTQGRVIGELTTRESECFFTNIGVFSRSFMGVRHMKRVNARNLPNGGSPIHDRDLICQFTGCSASFVIREVHGSHLIDREHFTSWTWAMDEDLVLECVLIGPCAIEAVELERRRVFRMWTLAIR